LVSRRATWSSLKEDVNKVMGCLRVVHEWALAEAIADYVLKTAPSARKVRVTVRLGELQAVEDDILEFALKEIMKSEGIECEVVLKREECVLKCRRCGFEWSLKEVKLGEEVREAIHFVPEVVHSYLKCPRCGSRDFEVVKGRGVWVEEVSWK